MTLPLSLLYNFDILTARGDSNIQYHSGFPILSHDNNNTLKLETAAVLPCNANSVAECVSPRQPFTFPETHNNTEATTEAEEAGGERAEREHNINKQIQDADK